MLSPATDFAKPVHEFVFQGRDRFRFLRSEAQTFRFRNQVDAQKGIHMAKYGKSAQRSVKRAMHKLKTGSLKSGKSGTRVKTRKQAIAIGLSEARRKGAKMPAK